MKVFVTFALLAITATVLVDAAAAERDLSINHEASTVAATNDDSAFQMQPFRRLQEQGAVCENTSCCIDCVCCGPGTVWDGQLCVEAQFTANKPCKAQSAIENFECLDESEWTCLGEDCCGPGTMSTVDPTREQPACYCRPSRVNPFFYDLLSRLTLDVSSSLTDSSRRALESELESFSTNQIINSRLVRDVFDYTTFITFIDVTMEQANDMPIPGQLQERVVVEYNQLLYYTTRDLVTFNPDFIASFPLATTNRRAAFVAQLQASSDPVLQTVTSVSAVSIINSSIDVPEAPFMSPIYMEWPDLLGLPATQAIQQLEAELGVGNYNIEIVPPNFLVTTDFRLDRIRLFVDDAGVIIQVPSTG